MAEWQTAGKVRMTPKGTWSGLVPYEILDCVLSPDNLKYYVAKQPVPANTALTNTDYWDVMSNMQDIADTLPEINDNTISATDTWSSQKIKNEIDAGDADLKSAFALFQENIPGTVQTIAFDSAGNIQSVTHKENNVVVRTDVFTFAASIITEVRTLASGESLTIVTNTDTLETTTTYAAA